jgi:DNA-binding MarR family transcriptional regulator
MKKAENTRVEMTLDDSFLTSKRAVEILKVVHESEEPAFASGIARNHDLDRSTASRLLSKLEARRLVERAERDKAIRYTVDYDGLATQAINITEVSLPVQQKQELQAALSSKYRTDLDRLETQKERFPTLRDFLILPIAIEPKSVELPFGADTTYEEMTVSFRKALEMFELIT